MNTDAEFNELCQREIVKIRELTLKDDEYTGGLLGDAVGSPVGITLCVEARMKQVTQQQATIAALEAKLLAAEGLRAELKDIAEGAEDGKPSLSEYGTVESFRDAVIRYEIGKQAAAALAAYEQAAGGSEGSAE